MKNSILIATKDRLTSDTLKELICNGKINNSIMIVHNGDEALNTIIADRPRLILLEAFLPVLSTIAIMEELHKNNLYPRVVCFCVEIDEVLCMKLFKAGVSGLIDGNSSWDEARKICKQVESGKVMIPDLIKESIESFDFENHPEKYTPLSRRQNEVLHLAGEGYSNIQISDKLNISRKTVEKHKGVIRNKMGLNSSTEIAVFAITHGFVGVKEVRCS
ncbi:MAG: response regulator transcription factor [Spirochaetales bacterium]|uniref:Response regulator transcription factor n=1 Tax=Candidatus Thalassospirochaeta sargassi TaxID=3119039 RepID=A0AAJ1IFS8_9SPIO|nr:response regulator transcription factor [Spirochaetales bacterium]